MTNKEKFISDIQIILDSTGKELSAEAAKFFEDLKDSAAGRAVGITENGIKILSFMQENSDKYNNVFIAKDIGEGLFMAPRSVSGSMRKLITDGYVIKSGQDPVSYSLTPMGKEKEIS